MRAPRTRFRASFRLASTVSSTFRTSSNSEIMACESVTPPLRCAYFHLGVKKKSQRKCVFPGTIGPKGWAREVMALVCELRLELIREFGGIFL